MVVGVRRWSSVWDFLICTILLQFYTILSHGERTYNIICTQQSTARRRLVVTGDGPTAAGVGVCLQIIIVIIILLSGWGDGGGVRGPGKTKRRHFCRAATVDWLMIFARRPRPINHPILRWSRVGSTRQRVWHLVFSQSFRRESKNPNPSE